MKISSTVLESFLHCPLKGFLKLNTNVGTLSDFEQMGIDRRANIRRQVFDSLLAKEPAETVNPDRPLTADLLRRGRYLILDVILVDEKFSLNVDGLNRVKGSSALGQFHYVPMLVVESRQLRTYHRTLLALYGLAIAS
jgi:hypothetical protein